MSSTESLASSLDEPTSHILLAACRTGETAVEFEDPSRKNSVHGAFIRCVVALLYRQDPTQMTYSALLDRLPPLEHQHPQCVGKNKHRILFNNTVLASTYQATFRIFSHGGTYRTDAGDIHGVVPGTPFAIHAPDNDPSVDPAIGIVEADCVFSRWCTLRRRRGDVQFDIPAGAQASVLNHVWHVQWAGLKIFIQSPHNDVQPVEHVFSLVDTLDEADLLIHRTDHDTLRFDRLDPLMARYIPVLGDISAELSLSDIVQSISFFNFHLGRHNSAQPLKRLIEVELHRLMGNDPAQNVEESISIPDGQFDMPLVPDRENTIFCSSDGTTSGLFYGLTLKNNSGRHLFPYLIYFDASDYSIQVTISDLLSCKCHADVVTVPLRFGITRRQAAWQHRLLPNLPFQLVTEKLPRRLSHLHLMMV
jgi:hypothetical protein